MKWQVVLRLGLGDMRFDVDVYDHTASEHYRSETEFREYGIGFIRLRVIGTRDDRAWRNTTSEGL